MKTTFLNWRSGLVTAGVLLVLAARPGMAAEKVVNLAAPARGGTLVWFTSRAPAAQMAHLTDGSTNSAGWRSRDGHLPQDLVFAFTNDQVVLIDRLVLNPKSPHPKPTWPTNFLLSISTNSPLDGFEEIGEFRLAPEPRDQEFPVARPARFVKIRFTRNGGGPFTSLGEVRLLGPVPTGQVARATNNVAGSPSAPLPAVTVTEQEPNDTLAQGNVLGPGQAMTGLINPPGETDCFRLDVPGPGPKVLTLDLRGRPNIRTSVELLDATGAPGPRFDPGQRAAERAEFSWLVPAGPQTLRLSEPAVSLVLVWDTSDSMRNDIGKLQEAVMAYLGAVRPGERLKLIRFSKDVEVITPEWSSDAAALRRAAAGKFKTANGTSCYDAFAKAVTLLEKVPGNRAIVLMTDGSDTSSVMDHPGFWRQLDQKRIRLYTIALGSGMKRYSPATGTVAERMLTHAALAANGRSFFTTNSAELKGLYQTIADEVRATSAYDFTATLASGTGALAIVTSGEPLATLAAPPQIELILDCSGSMTLDAGGRPRMEVAKAALLRIIDELPDTVRVGLRFYGHRIPDDKPGACEDTELVVPFGPVDKARLREKVQGARAVGATPIAHTLRQLPLDFGEAPGDKTVVLVTDGKEECKGDLAAALAEVRGKGIQVRLEIVGFALSERTLADRRAKKELEALAASTGGRFHDARNPQALDLALEASLAVPFEVLDAAGTRVAHGYTGRSALVVPEGIFTVSIRAAEPPLTVPNVRIVRGGTTRVALRKEGDEVGVRVEAP